MKTKSMVISKRKNSRGDLQMRDVDIKHMQFKYLGNVLKEDGKRDTLDPNAYWIWKRKRKSIPKVKQGAEK